MVTRLVFNYGNGEIHCFSAMGFSCRSVRRVYGVLPPFQNYLAFEAKMT